MNHHNFRVSVGRLMIINRIALLAFVAAVFAAPVSANLAIELCKDWAASEHVDPWDLEDYIRTCAEEIESTGAFAEEVGGDEAIGDEAIDEEPVEGSLEER